MQSSHDSSDADDNFDRLSDSSDAENQSDHFQTVVDSIRAPLANPYRENYGIKLKEDLTDEQFQQLEKVMEETLKEWRSTITLKDYTQESLKEIKPEIDKEISEIKFYNSLSSNRTKISEAENSESEEEDKEELEKELTIAEVQAAHDYLQELKLQSSRPNYEEAMVKEKLNIALMIEEKFKVITPTWYIEVKYTYNNEGFIKFLTSFISKKLCHYLHVNAVQSEKAIDNILRSCKDLPEEYISLTFSEDQEITEYQLQKMLDILPNISFRIEFYEKENSISESTAKKLTYSKYKSKLWIKGEGNYHNISSHARAIRTADFFRIFHQGLECSQEDVEELIEILKERNYPYNFEIRQGNYTTPAWKHFFETVLTNDKFDIRELKLGRLVEGNFEISYDVMAVIFAALKTNKTIRKLELRGITVSPELMTVFAESLMINNRLQEIALNSKPIKTHALSILFTALTINTNCNVHTLNLNYSYIGDDAAPHFAMLLTQNTRLRKLIMGNTFIRNETCKAIGYGLKINRTLNLLSLFENNLDDEAFRDVLEGALENNTLSELYISQYDSYSEDVIQSYLKFREHNYTVDSGGIDLITHDNLARSQELSARDRGIRVNKQLKMRTAYIWMAVILYRASVKNKFQLTHLPNDLIDEIMSFIIPKDRALPYNNLIKENVQTGQWRTTVTVPVPTYYGEEPRTREKPLFERWADPGYDLSSRVAIQRLRLNSPSEVDLFSANYFDIEMAVKLGVALKGNTWLTQLDLAMCHLDDAEFEYIAVGLLQRTLPLTVLNLDNNNLTAESFMRLRQLLINGKVKNLMVFNNKDLSTNLEVVKALKDVAKTYNAKIHFEADIKRNRRTGFFDKNPARVIIEEVPNVNNARRLA